MKKTFKTMMAVISAAAIAASLSGCMDNGYIMTVDGIEVRNGVYLSLQQTSINLANTKVNEQNAENSSGSDTSNTSGTSDTSASASSDTSSGSEEKSDIFDSVIDGKSYSDWIIDDTRAGVMRFVGIQRECERLGITLSDEEIAEITESIKKEWEDTSISYYGLGFETWGEYYESQGIGLESNKQLALVNKLNEKLFLHYYGEGGEWAVPEDEFNKYTDENFAGYNLITLQYLDYKGDLLVTDEEKQEVKDRAKGYADRFNNGEKLVDIMYDFDLLTARNKARKEAENSYSEEKAEGLTKEEYIKKAEDEVKVTKKEKDSEYDRYIKKGDSDLTEDLADYLFSVPADRKATVYEGKEAAYVVIRKPVGDLENWMDYYRTDLLREMKGDEFDSKMDIICQNFDVKQNDYLVNKKYSPEKIINKK